MTYALDTNIFIDAFRDPDAEAALLRFLERALPFTFLSAIVIQETRRRRSHGRAGASTRAIGFQAVRPPSTCVCAGDVRLHPERAATCRGGRPGMLGRDP